MSKRSVQTEIRPGSDSRWETSGIAPRDNQTHASLVLMQSPLNWTYLHGAEALNRCKEPMLLSMVLDNRLDDPSKHTTIRACTASEEVQEAEEISNASPFAFGKPEKRALDEAELAATCATDMHKSANETTLYYHEWLTDAGSNVSGNISDTTTTLSKLQEYISTVADDCKPSFVLAKTRNAIVGLFTGSSVGKQSVAPLVGYLANYIKDKENYEAGRVAIQNCHGKRPSAWGIGVVADLQGNITAVQESLANWRDAKCIESPDTNMPWMETVLDIWSLKASTSTNGTLPESNSTLARRADECRALQVGSGDTCTTMAQRCGISLTRFQNFNTAKNFCDPLMDKVWACCTVGDVPDFRPKPDADGICYSYDIGDGDGCWDVADAYYLKVADIESLNKQTWGWGGCGNLQAGQKICLSKGNPPMPNTISNAICGPQKPNGESRGNKKLADMNPCPLNVCCNFWGQCGMDRDFCVEAPADTGAPGTLKPGANGCIANCGMQITNNKEGPASFSHIAYFEAWNKERDCLHMDVTDIDTKKYTHIHFSFPDVTPGDFKVDVSRWQKQFDMMKKMTGIKRIVSLGGWANSAELPNYYIMRQAVMAQNRGVFVANIVSFVNEHGLDGIDIDWEYPGAENLGEGVPPGEADEGANYLETLKMLKRRMGSKSVSIAAPASYWYLRGFPIKDIGAVVDYIVYMTYDLHGQWDHGNKWATTGCPSGDCLRSHVNLTETQTSLAMITKAGVPSKKVFVGIASYGRSFKMAKAGCTGVDCKYTGTRLLSNARPGMCTDTGGYIASAEIREILWNKEVLGAREWHDKESDSDIVVYQDTEWLAWMNDKTKQDRILYYQSINFGGVSDWAVDLDKDYGDSGIGSGDPDDSSLSGGRTCPLSKTYKDLDSLAVDDSVADDCKPVLALGVLETMLDELMAMYEDTNNGYDENFEAYRRIMKDSVKEAALRFFHWRTGGYANYFDCDVKDLEDSRKNWNGPCSNIDEGARDFLKSRLTITVKMRDESGFYNALEEETGAAADWVQFGMHKEPDYDHNNLCPGTLVIGGEITCKPPTYGLVVNGIPVLKDDFEIANPKDIIKEISGNLEEVRDGMAARFFDIVAGIWDGGNGDVLQVYSVPIFLLSQAVGSMQTANEMGAEIREQQKKDFITLIISALLFFIPFVG
ncbi:chitinase [Plectosphaerella plurivora]|uniref:chitinase n=1 Tax=Plectosphaerella plurivora TaxID=936078 RepID=A0A9P8UQ72_9PEZI|nr:chitinase [Plectosphaerella plurivora]